MFLHVCVQRSWTNKGRGPIYKPIKEQEEWGRTRRPSMLRPSPKLEMASGIIKKKKPKTTVHVPVFTIKKCSFQKQFFL